MSVFPILSGQEREILQSTNSKVNAHIGPVPEGSFTPIVSEIATYTQANNGVVLLVVSDKRTMEACARQIRFWKPELKLATFPGWDCEPYDRVSPSSQVSSKRIATLASLAGVSNTRPNVVIATTSAISQKVISPSVIRQNVLILTAGTRSSMQKLRDFASQNGYERVARVNSPSEYAIRGGLLDIFPAGRSQPLRFDFFGDELETIKRFDAETQRSDKSIKKIKLLPARELLSTKSNIENYLSSIRGMHGIMIEDDPVYVATREGILINGLEHWLPWLAGENELTTIFDYIPKNTRVIYDSTALSGFADFNQRCENAYLSRVSRLDERKQPGERAKSEFTEAAYFPVPFSNGLYCNSQELAYGFKNLHKISISEISSQPIASIADKTSFEEIESLEQSENLDQEDNFLIEHTETSKIEGFHTKPNSGSVSPKIEMSRTFVRERKNTQVNLFGELIKYIRDANDENRQIVLSSSSVSGAKRLHRILKDRKITVPSLITNISELLPENKVAIALIDTPTGFSTSNFEVITEVDILGEQMRFRSSGKRKKSIQLLREFSTLGVGDYLVHIEHGIGKFSGMKSLEVNGAQHDCVCLEYASEDKLYVPVESLDLLSRYGSSTAKVELDRLGAKSWQARKARLKKRLKDLTAQLMIIAAKRESTKGSALVAHQGSFEEFCDRFPYPETEDQVRAIGEVCEDLAKERPMDRLICGDVGFGKTEVAMRAAFIAATNKIQTVLIAPTTLLARQHFLTFKERFSGFGIEIVSLSRLLTSKEREESKEKISNGKADIIIGTHALLSKSISIKNLGLLVIDEEQRFGVKHKERLKELGDNVNVLTLSATPIPRTMQLAMTGIRNLSLITTPPWDRLAVQTTVSEYDSIAVQNALRRERKREGQSFVICPRISDLVQSEIKLRSLVPELSIGVVHGRLTPAQVEETMTAFYRGDFDILLATTIVESGLDITNANTMIIERADRFGLAQLYQLRGRIGRSTKQSYAVLTVPEFRKITTDARRRLKLLQSLDSLGAGFKLASHDLDARGAGNLLGEEQSGHVREVGVELYQLMLEDAIAELNASENEITSSHDWSPQINIGLSAVLPENYISDFDVRLSLYRRIADMNEIDEVMNFSTELVDRFGEIPKQALELLQLIRIKIMCKKINAEKIDVGSKGVVIRFRKNHFAGSEKLPSWIAENKGKAVIRPDQSIVWLHALSNTKEKVKVTVGVLKQLKELIATPSK